MPRVIAVANQKGGVGKTTTTINIGVGLSQLGRSVILVDFDPQASLTQGLGVDPDSLSRLSTTRSLTKKRPWTGSSFKLGPSCLGARQHRSGRNGVRASG